MVIEANDGIIGSIIKGTRPLRVLRGERTWSPFQEKIEVHESSGHLFVETFTAEDPDTLSYTVERFRFGIKIIEETVNASANQINQPDQPWTGKIRWVAGSA